VGSLRRRLLRLACTGAILGAVLAGSAAAAGDLFVGAEEDGLLTASPQLTTSVARALGLRALHVTLTWQAGQTTLSDLQAQALDRAIVETFGLRLVVTVTGPAAAAPQTEAARADYCGFAADLLRRYPTINDVVVWSSPNAGSSWSPQFGADGASVGPAQYEALLATCWDTLHELRPAVNVVADASSIATGSPGGFVIGSHPPLVWYRKLGEAYRASGRTKAIFDTLAHAPRPLTSAERPWTKHGTSGPVGEGDYATLVGVLAEAFGGTAQPVPGQSVVRIWYVDDGFQTRPDPAKARLYRGKETDASALPAWSPRAATDAAIGPAPDQSTQLVDAVRLAYCEPGIGGFFTYGLADDPDLGGSQSGVLWADWSPKPSYAALRSAVAAASAGTIDCSWLGRSGLPPRPTQLPLADPLRISSFRVVSATPFSATVAWHTSLPVLGRLAYGLPATGPTLWAGVRGSGLDHTATLSGLRAGTAYRAWLTTTSADGQRTRATLDLATPGMPSSATSAIGAGGQFLVNGQPFFPFIEWSICPYDYAANLAAGINLFAENPCGGLRAQLSGLGGRALSAAVAGESAASGGDLIGFFFPDEPDGLGMSAESMPGRPAGVPGVGFLTLTNHFYSGAAPLSYGRDMYPGMIARADMIGFDLYPLQVWCRPERLGDDFDAQRELVQMSAGKPTFQWIETSEWQCPGGATAVTPQTVLTESWLAIAGGAQGLGFFPAVGTPPIAKVIGSISDQVAALGPALQAPSVAASSSVAQVRVGARSYGGAVYVFAVNAGYSAADAKISVPGLAGRPVSVFGEGRRLGAADSSFTDHFEPLAVHVYIAQPFGS